VRDDPGLSRLSNTFYLQRDRSTTNAELLTAKWRGCENARSIHVRGDPELPAALPRPSIVSCIFSGLRLAMGETT